VGGLRTEPRAGQHHRDFIVLNVCDLEVRRQLKEPGANGLEGKGDREKNKRRGGEKRNGPVGDETFSQRHGIGVTIPSQKLANQAALGENFKRRSGHGINRKKRKSRGRAWEGGGGTDSGRDKSHAS